MIDVIRIVEHQANLSSYRAAQDAERAVHLELLIEFTKPKNKFAEWDDLIATPFRYSPPFKNARFRPPFSARNVFYGALDKDTAFHEYTFHFMQERLHLDVPPEIGQRTLFIVEAHDEKAIDIRTHPDCEKIMDKNEYSYSHQFIEKHLDISFLKYPSCRDPLHRDNAAIFDIQHLEKKVKTQISIKYFYDYKKQHINWI